MATSNIKTYCSICDEETSTFICRGCLKDFCFDHLTEHREILRTQFHKIENDYNQFRQTLIDQKNDRKIRLLIQEINEWEEKSKNKIEKIANQCRQRLINYTNKFIIKIENKLDNTIKQQTLIRGKNEFNEIHLEELKQKLNKLKEELDKSLNVSIQQESTSFINKISIIIQFDEDTKWKQNGITMAGGNGRRNQLSLPYGIFIDDDQTIYIADCFNHRIVEWKSNATNGKIVAGGNGNGNRTNQLNYPIDVIIDKENNFFIISDRENRRVMRWSRQNNTNNGRIIIDDIDCYGLTMDKNGSLYVSDYKKNEVKRWKRGDRNGKIVAGGNGKGDYVNQLNSPTFIFVDEDYSLYVSDKDNHRVMKWLKGAKEGIVVVGGHGQGNSLKQLSYPQGVIVDQLGQIYVADGNNHRVMRWFEGAKEGTIVAGGNGDGEQLNQLYSPIGLSFDRQGNLYVADCVNHRIQKFEINETDDTFIELNDSLICNNDLVRPCFL